MLRSAGIFIPARRTRSRCRRACSPGSGCERILRAAFDAARKRPRKKLTSITKSNAQVYGMGLWDDVFEVVRKDYPDVQSSSLLVDAAAMDFVRKPESFDVVVASNLFGDILTDLSAAVTGSIGLASSREHQPDEEVPEHVRAGPRQRAGHRRERDRQPPGRDPLRGADARSSGTGEKWSGVAGRCREGAV